MSGWEIDGRASLKQEFDKAEHLFKLIKNTLKTTIKSIGGL